MKQALKAFLAGLAAMGAMVPGGVHAQPYPAKTISIVVPYAPGGPTDALAREIATLFSAKFAQTVIVESVPGGNSNIGTSRVMKASVDGHTLLLNNLAVATNPAFYPDVARDPSKELSAIGLSTAIRWCSWPANRCPSNRRQNS